MNTFETIKQDAEINVKIREYLDLSDQIRELSKQKEEILAGLPAGYIYQDEDTTKCFRIERPKGRFVYFPELDVVKMVDAEAKELGFDVQRQSRGEK